MILLLILLYSHCHDHSHESLLYHVLPKLTVKPVWVCPGFSGTNTCASPDPGKLWITWDAKDMRCCHHSQCSFCWWLPRSSCHSCIWKWFHVEFSQPCSSYCVCLSSWIQMTRLSFHVLRHTYETSPDHKTSITSYIQQLIWSNVAVPILHWLHSLFGHSTQCTAVLVQPDLLALYAPRSFIIGEPDNVQL